ncbi:hypothetical protein EON63_12790 [archaeon]|nr:MAG: hypothetical protein EON63_12790 [archaeon]
MRILDLLSLSLLFFLCSLVQSVQQDSDHAYFAICTCVKYEIDIGEWIEYHRLLGTGRFYIWDNSARDYMDVYNAALPYINTGVVVYERVHLTSLAQRHAYAQCYARYRNNHKFMAFFDGDEFINIVNKSISINTFLKTYEPYGALGLEWMEYGSSGHILKPPTGILPNFHKCHDNNTHVKLIINMEKFDTGKFWNPHQIMFNNSFYVVDENFKEIISYELKYHAREKIYLHHYVLKSCEDFARKHHRGSGWRPDMKGKTWKYFMTVDSEAIHECEVLKLPEEGTLL